MQKLLQLKLAGDFGVNSDIPGIDLDPSFFTSGINFKIEDGKLKSFNGSTVVATPTEGYAWNTVPITQTWDTVPLATTWETGSGLPQPYNDAAQLCYWIYGDINYYILLGSNAINAFDGASWYDFSSSGGYALTAAQAFEWTVCQLGGITVINNPNHTFPEYISSAISPTKFRSLQFSPGMSWATKGIVAKVIRSHKNFLFAMNLIESGVEYPDTYRWSNPADINSIPYTWDEEDVAAIAGRSSFSGSGGSIVDGMSMRDSFCMYSKGEINLLDYTGDDFVWRARKLSSGTGLLTQNCIAEFYGKHLFLSSGDLILNDGNSLESILTGRLRSRIANSISTTYYSRSFLVTDPQRKEIWTCIPEEGHELPNLAVVYNYQTNKISLRDLPENLSAATYGSSKLVTNTWNGSGDTWETATNPWNFNPESPFTNSIIGVDPTISGLYALSFSDRTIDYGTYLERDSYAFDSSFNVTTVLRAYPHIDCEGPVLIQFGSKYGSNNSIEWTPAVTFDPNTDRKVDLRTTGVYHAWKISSIGNNKMIYSGMDVEYVLNGVR